MDNFLNFFDPSGLSNLVSMPHHYFDDALSSSSALTTPARDDDGSESDATGSSRSSSWSNPSSPPPFRDQTPEVQPAFVNIRNIIQQQRHPERTVRETSKKENGLKAQPDDTLPLEELLEEADLKRKRLARKAELARLSRKRKKTRVQELESEVAQLRQELSRERVKVMDLENEKLKNVTVQTMERNLVSKFQKVCRAEQNPTSLGPAVDEYLDAHQTKNLSNQVQIAGYENAFGSSTTFNFVRWIMNQNEKFYEDPSGLWQSLFTQTLGCSSAQLQQLKVLRDNLGPKLQQWNELESALTKLCPLVRGYFGDAPGTLNSFVRLLTPTQTGKLFQWVDRFGEVCVKIKV